MDLTLKTSDGTDVMVLSPESADFEWGGDRNDFELVFEDSAAQPSFERWGYVYAEGTEYGGMLTEVKSEDGLVRWRGPTWTGMLSRKVLVPDAGQDHLTVSGEANAVLRQLVARMGLGDALAGSTEDSRIQVKGYQFELYCDGYSGIRAMLASAGAKLRVRHDGERAVLSALPVRDWSRDEEFDSDLVDVLVDDDAQFVNHLVARGQDEKQNRVSAELYLDERGNVSETQTYKGARERSEYYDYTSADRAKLVEDGTKRLKGYYAKAQSVSVTLGASDDRFDIGDVVGGTDQRTGISATATVAKKVLTVDRYGTATVSYETE